MSDRFYASIKIGGPIEPENLRSLIDAIQAEGVLDLEYGPVKIESAPELERYLVENRLIFCDNEASYGHFPALEAFLQERQIPYDRHSDSYFEFMAENVYFRPGMEEPVVRLADNDSREYVAREYVEELLAIKKRRTLKKRLYWILGEPVPTLPPIGPKVFE